MGPAAHGWPTRLPAPPRGSFGRRLPGGRGSDRLALLRDIGELAALVALLLTIISIPATMGYSAWARADAEKADWSIAGPACPVAAQPASAVVGRKAAKSFTYGEVAFTRQFGHASCNAWRVDGPRDIVRVCQFSGPGAVTVATGGRRVVYQPGVGRRATVSVRHGTPSCVVAGWFTG